MTTITINTETLLNNIQSGLNDESDISLSEKYINDYVEHVSESAEQNGFDVSISDIASSGIGHDSDDDYGDAFMFIENIAEFWDFVESKI